ncbi:MAG TPA: hypothetical protein VFT82_01180 [Candidatus Paceibacterota bacterium]|nr:hypothetical protein [Candidatus Paceibacterota bacterium]
MKIGFIGQGWVGKNYADDFEKRGYDVVRYALEEPYRKNRAKISGCDITFIAVPTPTVPGGFNDSIVREAVKLVGKGKIAVIKSTVIPYTTESIQDENPEVFVFHSPEFLVEATAARDAANPGRNIVGIPRMTDLYRKKAQEVLDVLPKAPFEKIMSARDAEFVKYAGNCFLFTKVVYMNILYDLVRSLGGDWQDVREAFAEDPRIGKSHTEPIHKTGRGAGGHCFIKDFEAFRLLYEKHAKDPSGTWALSALRDKNISLLVSSKKDIDLIEGVYGKNFAC